MAKVEIESFQSFDHELIMLYHLCNHEKRQNLLAHVYPTLFYHKDIRGAVEILKSLPPEQQNSVAMIFEIHKINGIKETEPWDEFFTTEYQHTAEKVSPYGLLSRLKEFLFKRLANERLVRMANLVEQGRSYAEQYDTTLFAETTELLLLQDKLLGERKRTTEQVARLVAERINTQGDLVITGFDFLNRRISGLTRRTLSSLLALPGHYKSSFCDALMYETIKSTSEVGLIISLEDPIEERVKRIVANRLDISLSDMRFKKVIVPEADILAILKIELGERLIIYDPRDVLTPAAAAAAISDVKPGFCIVDHIQNFELENMVEGLIKAAWYLETAAIRNNCHVLVTSQVSDKKVMMREDVDILASDAQWTSALRQKSSEMFSLLYQYQFTRNMFQMDKLKFSILKSRYALAIGSMILQINPDRGRILGPFAESFQQSL